MREFTFMNTTIQLYQDVCFSSLIGVSNTIPIRIPASNFLKNIDKVILKFVCRVKWPIRPSILCWLDYLCYLVLHLFFVREKLTIFIWVYFWTLSCSIDLFIYPFPIWNQSVVPCPVPTVASWPAYRFLKRQVRWSLLLQKDFDLQNTQMMVNVF